MNPQILFPLLFKAQNESEIDTIVTKYSDVFANKNWKPIGSNESNYGIIENQQANPIAALVEKVTNSMDAILMKKCQQADIDPKSSSAPQSMEAAVKQFFPDFKQWDLQTFRRKQAEEIQVLADGSKRDVSVIIYDNGEGQHPHDFEHTFLSLVRGNKNDTMFVQGKYNMGGAGAIVFCGKRGYQLIASRKAGKTGKFGFALTRQRPFTQEDARHKKNTWYELLSTLESKFFENWYLAGSEEYNYEKATHKFTSCTQSLSAKTGGKRHFDSQGIHTCNRPAGTKPG